jgi:leader peptidase (prepilin peptidase)/N-methyltransferase
VVEALAPLLFFFIWWRFRQPLEIVTFCLFTSILIVVTFVDLECQVIPNLCTYPGIGVGVALSFLPGGVEPLDCLSGAMCGGGLLYLFVILSPRLFGKEGMGGGDVKLAGVIGTFLGLKAVLLSIFIASLVGSIVGLALIVGRKISRSDYLPFAPFMSLGTLVMLFFGQEVTHLVRW